MKLLIIKTSSLGDIIHAFPVLEYIKEKHPSAQIDWVVERPFAELVETHPYVKQVYYVDTKKWRNRLFQGQSLDEMYAFRSNLQKQKYEAVFDLQSNIKSGFISFFANSQIKVGYGWKTVHEKPNMLFTNLRFNPPSGINVRDENLFIVQSYFNDFTYPKNRGVCLEISHEQAETVKLILQQPPLQRGLKVMVCPGSAWKNKQLSLDTLVNFLKLLQEELHCTFLFVWGSSEERELSQCLQNNFKGISFLVDKLPLAPLQNLMGQVDLVIAMDSLPLHLAGTTATPTFSVFGASSSHKYKPQGSHHFSFQGACPYHRSFERRCPVLRTCSTGSCMHDMSARHLFKSFQGWWSSI